MKKASPFTFLQLKKKQQLQKATELQQEDLDLNIFVVTFSSMKQAQSNLSGGDPYTCQKCKAILNKYSTVISHPQCQQNRFKLELKLNESLWECQFCGYPNIVKIDKEEIPTKEDVVYLVESDLEKQGSDNQATMVFCIDASGSMNTTTEIQGKVDLKFGISQEEIQMLRQFMQPGDQLQLTFLPGNHNKNKTFISRKQCILSAIESQLKQLKKSDPLKRVGFVTFNSEVTVMGDNKTPTVNIVGDKLSNRQSIVDSLAPFKLQQPLGTSFDNLIKQLQKQQAKGQTALGPALVSAIEVASKGSPGSTVILCTDGLANVGVGYLDPLTEENRKFYEDLGNLAKQRNISVSIITIKGQGSKMEVIGKLAQLTHGNMKVVNPEKISQDFANVLKDQVVGVNVEVTIQLHKAMNFRNEDKENLFENKTILKKKFPNATVNTKVSFQYELRCQEDLKFLEVDVNQLKKVPFQTQIFYTSPRGGKFLRVVSSQSKTTTDKNQSIKDVNIGVAHQRVAAITTNLYSKGDHIESVKRNQLWSDYLTDNFQEQKYQHKQQAFQQKNAKLSKAIQHKSQKLYNDKKVEKKVEDIKEKLECIQEKKEMKGKKDKKDKKQKESVKEEKLCEMEEEEMNKSLVDSDEDQAELMENLMEKRSYNMSDDDDDVK